MVPNDKRQLQEHHCPGFGHTGDFFQCGGRFADVFEHFLRDDQIERGVLERYLHTVVNDVHALASIDVQVDDTVPAR